MDSNKKKNEYTIKKKHIVMLNKLYEKIKKEENEQKSNK